MATKINGKREDAQYEFSVTGALLGCDYRLCAVPSEIRRRSHIIDLIRAYPHLEKPWDCVVMEVIKISERLWSRCGLLEKKIYSVHCGELKA